MAQLRGEQHPLAKLTRIQVEVIKRKYAPGLVTYDSLAREYSVSKTTISRIINGTLWVAEHQLPATSN